MAKQKITIEIDESQIKYLEKISNELNMGGAEDTIVSLISDSGKEWFDEISRNKFLNHVESVPIYELIDIISTIPFMTRRFEVGFDVIIKDIIINRLVEWDEAIPELINKLYRLNNIRILARDRKVLASELDRALEDDSGIELPIYNKEDVIKLLVSAHYKS